MTQNDIDYGNRNDTDAGTPFPRRERDPRDRPVERQNQITLTGKLIQTRGDGEAVVFSLRVLNMIKLSFVVNIPFAGDKTSPVYCRLGSMDAEDILQEEVR
jgi:hypothetical protein